MSEIKVDTVAEKTSANGVTIDGLNIKDSKLVTANSIVASNITDGAVTSSKLSAGKILQVVSGTLLTETGSSSGSYVDTGLDVLITPSASSSKIFVTCSFGTHNNGANRTQYYTLYRGSTNLHSANGSGFFSTYGENGSTSQGGAINFLDSPNTTSQIEYSVYMKADAGTAYISLHGSTSTITVMEVSA